MDIIHYLKSNNQIAPSAQYKIFEMEEDFKESILIESINFARSEGERHAIIKMNIRIGSFSSLMTKLKTNIPDSLNDGSAIHLISLHDDKVQFYKTIVSQNYFELKTVHDGPILGLFNRFFDKDALCNDLLAEKWQDLTSSRRPHEILQSSADRTSILKLSEWMAETGRYNESRDLLEKFLYDPDPKPQDHFHQKIENGESDSVIYTVRGTLCWSIQKIAIHKGGIKDAWYLAKQLLHDPNLYVSCQLVVPLTEIAVRYKPYGIEAEIPDFHDELISFTNRYGQYSAIAERLCRLFSSYRNVNTEERMSLLARLSSHHEVGILYVIYGLDSFNQPRGASIELKEKLKNFLCEENLHPGKRSAVWFMFRSLVDNRDNPLYNQAFEEILSYVNQLLDYQKYDADVHSHIDTFGQNICEWKPDQVVDWYLRFMPLFEKFVEESPHRVYFRPKIVIEACAKSCPTKLPEFLEKISRIWLAGASIGDPLELFKLVELVKDEHLRCSIIQSLHSTYNSMRVSQPALSEWL
ncbi:MAG: hypothetical protein ACOH5I_15360 [Oligoflexus sp.]